MKKLLFISCILLLLTACQKSTEVNQQKEEVAQIQENEVTSLSDYEKAKATLDELFLHAERLKKGEISKEITMLFLIR